MPHSTQHTDFDAPVLCVAAVFVAGSFAIYLAHEKI